MVKISEVVEQDTGERIGLPGEAPELETPIAPEPLNLEWLRTPTGPGGIEEYIEHPLNFQRSRGLAQVLRGATGFLGDIKLAVVDVVIGGLNYAKERTHGPTDTISR